MQQFVSQECYVLRVLTSLCPKSSDLAVEHAEQESRLARILYRERASLHHASLLKSAGSLNKLCCGKSMPKCPSRIQSDPYSISFRATRLPGQSGAGWEAGSCARGLPHARRTPARVPCCLPKQHPPSRRRGAGPPVRGAGESAARPRRGCCPQADANAPVPAGWGTGQAEARARGPVRVAWLGPEPGGVGPAQGRGRCGQGGGRCPGQR